jgi:hypothetical protein
MYSITMNNRPSEVIDADDARMLQTADQLDLAFEAQAAGGQASRVLVQDFDRHAAVCGTLRGHVDHALAAAGQLAGVVITWNVQRPPEHQVVAAELIEKHVGSLEPTCLAAHGSCPGLS